MTLRRRILLLATGLTALVLVLFAVPLALALKQSASDRVVREMQYVAQGVADYLTTNSYNSAQVGKYVTRVNARNDARVTVLLPDGTTLGAQLPEHAPKEDVQQRRDERPDQDSDDLGQVSEPRTRRVDDGWLIDIMANSSSGNAVVRTYVPDGVVNHEIHERWTVIAGGSLALLVIAAVGAEVVSRRLTHPLVATGVTAAALSAGDLDARAPVDGAPEIAQVASALNHLADRIESLLASERETIADLSHRLRTPLTAIRLDVEALPDSDRSRDLTRHVATLERTLTAVIEHARLPRRERNDRSCDARTVLLDRVTFWTPLAEDQGRIVTIDEPGSSHRVGCTAEELTAALDALIENVIAHTPEGTSVEVTLRETSTGAEIDVTDHGSGIPLGATRRGRSDRGSSGLGLDIARSCAESTGGRLDVLSAEDGSHTVRLVLHETHSSI